KPGGSWQSRRRWQCRHGARMSGRADRSGAAVWVLRILGALRPCLRGGHMSRIHIVSASAGSGKTYRLAELLEQEVVAGRARPDAIVATTFTRDAASELMTRVRRRFVEHGLQKEALLLEAARIGTVHSVCGRFVETATFELGLPPDLQVLDEVVARTTFREVLSGLMTPELRRELEALEHRM